MFVSIPFLFLFLVSIGLVLTSLLEQVNSKLVIVVMGPWYWVNHLFAHGIHMIEAYKEGIDTPLYEHTNSLMVEGTTMAVE